MERHIKIQGPRGSPFPITVKLSEKIIDVKKRLNQENAIWRLDVEPLTNERTFESYGIEDEDTISSSAKVIGGIN